MDMCVTSDLRKFVNLALTPGAGLYGAPYGEFQKDINFLEDEITSPHLNWEVEFGPHPNNSSSIARAYYSDKEGPECTVAGCIGILVE
jgi:hypothetical protein